MNLQSAPSRLNVAKVLSRMPKVFTGANLCNRYCLKPGHARTALHRWHKSGLIDRLDARLDVYFNAQRFPDATWKEDAIALVDPCAVFHNATTLQMAGWTTQIAQQPIVAFVSRRVERLDGFSLLQRSAGWFGRVGGVLEHKLTLPTLRPAWALADAMLKPDDQWLPAPDDLDWMEISSEHVAIDLANALHALGDFYFRFAHRPKIQACAEGEDIESWYTSWYDQHMSVQQLPNYSLNY